MAPAISVKHSEQAQILTNTANGNNQKSKIY